MWCLRVWPSGRLCGNPRFVQLRLADNVEIALYDDDDGVLTWVEPETLIASVVAKWKKEMFQKGTATRQGAAHGGGA